MSTDSSGTPTVIATAFAADSLLPGSLTRSVRLETAMPKHPETVACAGRKLCSAIASVVRAVVVVLVAETLATAEASVTVVIGNTIVAELCSAVVELIVPAMPLDEEKLDVSVVVVSLVLLSAIVSVESPC
mmetsp:Transcript_92753/g.164892  ORF Transcript_92753/g.164892 Transcript_92753/m.164892 type:complete len:131 (-) Transcript_92753:434-826(-)